MRATNAAVIVRVRSPGAVVYRNALEPPARIPVSARVLQLGDTAMWKTRREEPRYYRWDMRTVIAALMFIYGCAFAEDAPKTMTKLTVKLESPEVPKDSFGAQPKLMYRAGLRYCRIEENPDLEHGIHGLLVINEPDSWMINRLTKVARHIVDPGPTFNCRLPIFANVEENKSTAQDVKELAKQLEFGRELEYFRSGSNAPNPGPVLRGKSTMVYSIEANGSQLFLFTGGDPEAPVAVVRKNDKTREIFWYGEYAQVPFDPKLFAKPEGVKIEEVKP